MDLGTVWGGRRLVSSAVQIGGAAVIFSLVCRWLQVPAELAGVSRQRVERVAVCDRRRLAVDASPAVLSVAIAADYLTVQHCS